MTILDDMKQRCRAYDDARPRSSQAAVGWSEVGGCRSHIGYRVNGDWPTDQPDKWAALRGTVIGEFLEDLVKDVPGVLTQVETSYRGIPGHSDVIITADGVWDIKTTKLVNALAWRSSEAALYRKRVQINGYAAGLIADGKLPANCRVGLIVIPIDGTYDDWWLWEEEFSRPIADEGVDRLEDVRRRLGADLPLPKDMPYAWCQNWCEFFSLCRGGDDPLAMEQITDPELVALIDAYGEANALINGAKKIKDPIAAEIRGLRGTAGGWRITLGKAGQPKTVLDEAWIRTDYMMRDEPVPVRTLPGDAPKLYVRAVKS